jgi:hypothetical protein
MIKWKACGRSRQYLSLRYHLSTYQGTEGNNQNPQSGESIPWKKFEQVASRIEVTSYASNHLTRKELHFEPSHSEGFVLGVILFGRSCSRMELKIDGDARTDVSEMFSRNMLCVKWHKLRACILGAHSIVCLATRP